MHKLIRGIPPKSLNNYNYKRQKWSEYILDEDNKTDIWDCIFEMQGYRCAYCECELTTFYNGHVEHFFQKRCYQKLTFEWDNLFGSCRRHDGCGFYKDEQDYIQGVLLKFDIDDPDDFFDFLYDGSIIIKNGLSAINNNRAVETLRVFNLDEEYGSLRQQRASAIKLYINLINELHDYIDTYGVDENFEMLLAENLQAIDGVPFETAIRHMFY